MKPPVFDYVAPGSLDEALELLAEHGDDAKILAGGQSLIPLMNFRLAQPALLVDLNGLHELAGVRVDGEGRLRIGGMTRQRTLEREPLVAERSPLLAETIPFVAHPQIRNRGTVGGNLAHADPSSELPVVAVTLGAELVLKSKEGERTVGAEDFFVGLMTTALEPHEILVETVFPAAPPRTGISFMEVSRRHGDYAQCGVAATVSVDESGAVVDARLVFLSVGEIPMRARRAEEALAGEPDWGRAVAAAAALAAEEEIEPTDDIHASAAFKRHLAGVLTRRALETARARAVA